MAILSIGLLPPTLWSYIACKEKYLFSAAEEYDRMFLINGNQLPNYKLWLNLAILENNGRSCFSFLGHADAAVSASKCSLGALWKFLKTTRQPLKKLQQCDLE